MTKMKEIAQKVVEDLKRYKQEHKCGGGTLSKLIGASPSNVNLWIYGKGFPSEVNIRRCIKAGLTDVRLPDNAKAIVSALEKVDKKNKVPRPYRRRVDVPVLVSNELKAMLGAYMVQLNEPKTYQEFERITDEFIKKIYYICSHN